MGPGSGWHAQHQMLVEAGNDSPAAVLPCYLKDHSWGEYVFDWSWANAYQRHGLTYYPKLVCAIPFTPATGPRMALAPELPPKLAATRLVEALDDLLAHHGASSWHLLFPDVITEELLSGSDLLRRTGLQYHWHNRNYQDFDDFLNALNARKRKTIRRERRLVTDQGLELRRLTGDEIDAGLWARFYHFYQITYARRSGHGGYLSAEFFAQIGASMPEQIMMVLALRKGELVAAALNFYDAETLYGRYWGSSGDFNQLHFEACYYQGIEFCIERGLSRFDAGAQGEHKIKRGFEPVATHSLHRIAHPGFRQAIATFLEDETREILSWIDQAREQLPYKR